MIMFAKRRTEPFVKVPAPVKLGAAELSTTEFYQPSPIDDFLFQKHGNDEEHQSVRVTSDIYMLFNQKRLDRMTNQALIEHFNSMAVTDPQMAALRSKMSDEQLCSFVKSRFIQSRSELLAWSQYLMSAYDAEVVAAAGVDLEPVVDPAPDADPVNE